MRICIAVLMLFPALSWSQADEWCVKSFIEDVTPEQILVCYRDDASTCFVRDPRDVVREQAENRRLVRPRFEQIDFAQHQRETAKQGCRQAMRAGDIDTAFLYTLDMIYWATRMAAGGAFGVELAAPYGSQEQIREQVIQGARNADMLEDRYDLPGLVK